MYQGGNLLYSFDSSAYNEIDIAPASVGITLTVDFSNGNCIPQYGINFGGGFGGTGPGSTLILKGDNSFSNEVITPTGPNSAR